MFVLPGPWCAVAHGIDAIVFPIYAHRFSSRGQFEVKASRLERGEEDTEEVELGLKWAVHDDLEAT